MKKWILLLLLGFLLPTAFSGCAKEQAPAGGGGVEGIKPPKDRDDTEGLLTYLQKAHFEYMWSGACPNSGLARVRYHDDNPSHDANTITVGASGFGMMGIIVAVERGFISRDAGIARFEKIIGFLERADRFHGMYPHWLDDRTAKVIAFAGSDGVDNGADIVETSFLASGLLCVRQYLKNGTEREKALSVRIDKLWKEMEWSFFVRTGEKALTWHWSPTYGWQKNMKLQGYNECFLPYLLGAASPTFALSDAKGSYQQGWFRSGSMTNTGSRFGIPMVVKHNTGSTQVGPMFWLAFSFAGFRPSGWMDTNGIDYGKAVQNHARIQYAYCVDNPNNWKCYGEDSWGLTAGYSVGGTYEAHSTNNDKGVISPDAALIAMPYLPQESIRAAKHYYWDMPQQMGPWGFWDGFGDSEGTIKRYLANNQCAVAPMIENYRSGKLWDLFMSAPEITAALGKLGFTPVSD